MRPALVLFSFFGSRLRLEYIGFFRCVRRPPLKPAMKWWLTGRGSNYRVVYVGPFKLNLPARDLLQGRQYEPSLYMDNPSTGF